MPPLAPARSGSCATVCGGRFLVTLWLMTTLLLVTRGPYQPAQNWVSLPPCWKKMWRTPGGVIRRCGKPGEGERAITRTGEVMMAELEKGRVEPSPARLSLQARRQKLQAVDWGILGPWGCP